MSLSNGGSDGREDLKTLVSMFHKYEWIIMRRSFLNNFEDANSNDLGKCIAL